MICPETSGKTGDDRLDDIMRERYELASGRVREIVTEETVPEPFGCFFRETAAFLQKTMEVMEEDGEDLSLEELGDRNHSLYQDVLPENYGTCWGNPAWAARMLGDSGQALSFLYRELSGTIVYAHEKRLWDMTVSLELFLEIYSAFSDGEIPDSRVIRNILCSYCNDYCQDMTEARIEETVDPSRDFALRVILDSDLSDLRYLYRYGEYISENELGAAGFLASLTDGEVEKIARTYTEGYRMGFVIGRKDLSRKKTVQIRFHLGFERIVRAAVFQFREMRLEPVISRYALHVVNRTSQARVGYTGAVANPQYEYDHRQDWALFLDGDFVARKLRSTRNGYEKCADLAAVLGGPALLDTFGENPFRPENKAEALTLTEAQQKLLTQLNQETGQIVNRYIPGEERSFTIIAWPVPEIAQGRSKETYPEIFREFVKINTLDSRLYQEIQQKIIDALDTCQWVEVRGRAGNQTRMRVRLHELACPDRQSNFENCVADVNIPVGEVFTSPLLEGTEGILHVKRVYLNGLQYRDLRLTFRQGRVVDYTCGNFEREEDNQRYVEENILFHHEALPIGEFAIGTNTRAYVAGQRSGIEEKLPILIAEKTGPHFAVGDTCYSWSEDTPVFNPDGKELIARDNEVSILRREDLNQAYFGCHTDITIPYEEVGIIRGVRADGTQISVIEDGRFVLPGTEALNEPFLS
ncbi:MAG: aminopeptidase [Clostridiales bacterium]|nr:aminopeptidase [Clostridiales bacterium]